MTDDEYHHLARLAVALGKTIDQLIQEGQIDEDTRTRPRRWLRVLDWPSGRTNLIPQSDVDDERRPTVAQSYIYTLKDNGTAVPLGAVTCALVGTATNCSAPLSGALPTATSHTLVLTAANAFGSTDSAPTTGNKPGTPTGFTITITVTVQGAP
jgi:hypothetical protein